MRIKVKEGKWRGTDCAGIEGVSRGPIKQGKSGWFVNLECIPPGFAEVLTARVKLPNGKASIEYLDLNSDRLTEVMQEETDAEIIARIDDRFDILNELARGISSGVVRCLIVSGAPGVGKSYGLEAEMSRAEGSEGLEFTIVRGTIASAFQLYMTLFDHKEAHQVLILDDCDTLLWDPSCINMLKGALETGSKPRVLDYQSESVNHKGVPQRYEYEGRIVFISNIDFQKVIDRDRGAVAKHFAALIDRSLYLDLMLHNKRELWCRVSSMVKDHGLLDEFRLGKDDIAELLGFIQTNIENLRTLSLRTAINIARFMNTDKANWERMAKATLLRPPRR